MHYYGYYDEQETESQLPREFRPITAWGYLGYELLFLLPVIGFLFVIIFSISGSHVNRRGFARYHLLLYILAFAAEIVLFSVFLFKNGGDLQAVLDLFKPYYTPIVDQAKDLIAK
ncbi:MAG: hypothetical protein J6R42_00745 [Clostridia bacterium]|nr:hypothetical protein [Clostridia bacterium]